jgi:hypothetical protein
MAGKPAAASSAGPREKSERDTADESALPRELVGPLDLERLSKDDGRALLLYTSVQPPPT